MKDWNLGLNAQGSRTFIITICIMVTLIGWRCPGKERIRDRCIVNFYTPYKSIQDFFLNDSNGHGCYFKKLIILIFE
jgi:hypothetical protein